MNEKDGMAHFEYLNDMTPEQIQEYIKSMDPDEDIQNILIVNRYIEDVEKSYNKFSKQLGKLKTVYSSGRGEDSIGHEALELVRASETLTQKVRNLPMQLNFPYKKEVDQIIEEYSRCELEFLNQDRVLHIVMPALLPKWKTSDNFYNISCFRYTYLLVFSEFFKQRKFKVYEESVVVIYYHHYLPGVKVRDNDNMETKAIQDIIAMFTLPSDNPYWLETYTLSGKSEKDCNYTEIYVVPQSMFADYLLGLKRIENK